MTQPCLWIRTDASIEIGTGHVYRCLSIARELKRNGIESKFLCRVFEANLIDLIEAEGFQVIKLPEVLPAKQTGEAEPKLKHSHWLHGTQAEDFAAVKKVASISSVDCLLIDHFALDCTWQTLAKKSFSCKTLVIDGQADRAHCSDWMIDPNLCVEPSKWQGLLAEGCQLKQGMDFVPVSPAFENITPTVRKQLQTILIGFGGVDQANYTLKALKVVLQLPVKVLVVVGKNYPHQTELKASCEALQDSEKVELHIQTKLMAELMTQADLAIGAGGTMIYERCMAWLPSLVTVVADNQQHQVDCAVALDFAAEVSTENYEQGLSVVLHQFLNQPAKLEAMSSKAKQLADSRQKHAWTELLSQSGIG